MTNRKDNPQDIRQRKMGSYTGWDCPNTGLPVCVCIVCDTKHCREATCETSIRMGGCVQ